MVFIGKILERVVCKNKIDILCVVFIDITIIFVCSDLLLDILCDILCVRCTPLIRVNK